MSSRDVGFNAHEKVEILAEIVKAGNVHPDVLLHFIREHGIQPDWGNVALPRGRTLNQCVTWFNSAMPRPSGPVSGTLRPQIFREPEPSSTLKRPYNPEQAAFGGRPLVPKPPMTTIGNILNEPPEPPKKKRGRPTKAEIEARKEAAVARSGLLQAPKHESGTVVAGPSLAAVAAQAAMTPRPPEPPGGGSAGASDSSSTKKKRGRPSKAESETQQVQDEPRPHDIRTTPTRYPNILLNEGDRRENEQASSRLPPLPPQDPDPTGPR